jgi:competence protein ComEC
MTLGCGPVSMSAARLIARVAGLPCAWLVFVARTFSKAPAAAVPWPSGAVGAFELLGLLVVAVAVATWLRARRHSQPRRNARRSRASVIGVRLTVVAGVVVSSGFVIAERSPPHWPPSGWVLATCDVGTTAAVVVRTGPQAAMLVDAGPQPSVIDGCLQALGVHSVPLIVLAGGTSSSIDGLPGALHGRRVGVIDVVADLDAETMARVRGWSTVDHVAISTSRVQLNAVGDVRWQVVDDAVTRPAVALAFPGGTALVAADQSAPAIERMRPAVLIAAHAGARPAGPYRPEIVIDPTAGRSTAVWVAALHLRVARTSGR